MLTENRATDVQDGPESSARVTVLDLLALPEDARRQREAIIRLTVERRAARRARMLRRRSW